MTAREEAKAKRKVLYLLQGGTAVSGRRAETDKGGRKRDMVCASLAEEDDNSEETSESQSSESLDVMLRVRESGRYAQMFPGLAVRRRIVILVD